MQLLPGALKYAARLGCFILLLALLDGRVLAAPLKVHLTGGFANQHYTITYGNGDRDEITLSATVDVVLTPTQPGCDDTEFASSKAQLTGTIHLWGTAIQYDPFPSLTHDFDNTWNYSYGANVSLPIRYEAQTGFGDVLDLDWTITTSVDRDKATPYALHYYGNSRTLRLWVALPYPFWYPEEYEYYDTTGTVAVSGQESVNSCVNGTVTDAGNGQPIAGAQIRLGNVSQTTPSTGVFDYGNIPANTYELTVSHPAYFPSTNYLAIPAFTIVRTNIPLTGIHLKLVDANPWLLGSVFLIGARLPLDPSHPYTPQALEVLAQASTARHGLAADGCTRLLLRFEADVPGKVTFNQADSSLGSLTDVYGNPPTSPIETAKHGDKHMAYAVYTAPDTIQHNTESDVIRAVFSPDGWTGPPLQTSNRITIIHTPVVLVHGLWGKPTVWNTLDTQLKANGFLTDRVDYYWYWNAAAPFNFYLGFVKDKADTLLESARSNGFAATRVDVVAHSMGGILTRLDASNPLDANIRNDNLGTFRRIITIDTPHYGSRAATVLLDLAEAQPLFGKVFRDQGNPIDYGGVADLDPLTFADSVRKGDTRLPAIQLPWVALGCTVWFDLDLPPKDEKAAFDATKMAAFTISPTEQQRIFAGQTVSLTDSAMEVADKVFTIPQMSPDSMPHDGIVPLISQQGGCSLLVSGLPFSFVAHTAAPADGYVDQRVISLLKGSVSAFDENGFPRVTGANLAFQIPPSSSLSPVAADQPMKPPSFREPRSSGPQPGPQTQLMQLLISSPLGSVTPGASVAASVAAIPGVTIDGLFLMAVQDQAVIASATTTNVPAVFMFNTPSNSLGTVTVLAMAGNALGETDLQETNLVLRLGTGTNPQSLVVTPAAFTFTGIGQGGQLAVSAVAAGGSRFDVTSAGTAAMYSSSATSVASVNSSGIVTAVGQGTATVSVSYGTLTTNVLVTVSLHQPVIQSTTPASASQGQNSLQLDIVGSCLGGASSIEFYRDGVLDPTVSATNLNVGAGGFNLRATVSVAANTPAGLRTVVVTTPAGRSSLLSAPGNRFFVGTPLRIEDFHYTQSVTNPPQVHLHLVGSPGALCLLQSSTNLSNWDAVATNSLHGGDWFFDQYLPSNQAALFYRAVLLP